MLGAPDGSDDFNELPYHKILLYEPATYFEVHTWYEFDNAAAVLQYL